MLLEYSVADSLDSSVPVLAAVTSNNDAIVEKQIVLFVGKEGRRNTSHNSGTGYKTVLFLMQIHNSHFSQKLEAIYFHPVDTSKAAACSYTNSFLHSIRRTFG